MPQHPNHRTFEFNRSLSSPRSPTLILSKGRPEQDMCRDVLRVRMVGTGLQRATKRVRWLWAGCRIQPVRVIHCDGARGSHVKPGHHPWTQCLTPAKGSAFVICHHSAASSSSWRCFAPKSWNARQEAFLSVTWIVLHQQNRTKEENL